MPYANTAAVSRPEISAFLEEAIGAERYFIGQLVMPIYTSKARAGRYPRMKIEGGELLRAQSTKRSPTGTYNEVTRRFDWDTYDCVDRGLEERVDDAITREMADFFDAEVLTGKLVTRGVMLDYEVRVAEAVMNDDNFNATNGSVVYSEANIATIDFPKDLMEAKERLTRKAQIPNTLILSESAFNRIRRSTKLQTFLYGTLGQGTAYRLVNPEDIAKAFLIERVMVASATYDSSVKGSTAANLIPIWGNDYLFLGNVQGGDFSAGGVGRTIVWGADCPGGLVVTETYRAENRRGDMVRVRQNTAEKIIDGTAGELISTRWA